MQQKMNTKDIIILSLVAVVLIIRLYMNYNKKKGQPAAGRKIKVITKGGGLSSQPDDYEPYSGK